MPELPEVETTRRGIAPHIQGRTIRAVTVRNARLRWPVPRGLEGKLRGLTVQSVGRRAKYLLLGVGDGCTTAGTVIIHLGMSGSLRIVPADQAPGKHDHVDICLDNASCLRLTDPRRFGAVLWHPLSTKGGGVAEHELLARLGPEPLEATFDTEHLFQASRGKRVAVKQFIMDGAVVVGVGNIYASESLFLAGINPKTAAGRITRPRYERLVAAIKQVLAAAIAQGGTTLRDFVGGDGKPGYFAQQLNVYGREGEPCRSCGTAIRAIRQGQRATYYCPHCQH